VSAPEGDLRVAVVGVGHLGQHHARIYSSLKGCRLVAVVDTDPARGREVASRHGAPCLTDLDGLEGRVDAVSLAVPTESHCEIACRLLEAGVAVLVEKPIASTLQEADRMIEAARRGGVLLGVGHTERFNPAVEALRRRVENPRFVEAHRLGSFAPRSLDIDVVLDLMIHDIDIVLDMVGSPVRAIEAVGVNALTPRVDIANARVVFESGCVANLTASRISAAKTRKIRVFQPDSYLSCDCAGRTLDHYRIGPAGDGGRPSIVRDQAAIDPEEPLLRELAAFADSLRGGPAFPVSAEAGRAALEVALGVVRRIADSLAREPH